MVLRIFKKKGEKAIDKRIGGAMYYDVSVKEIIRETEDAISIVFENPNNEIRYKPGQFITLILNIENQEHRRSYSLNSSPDYESDLSVTVKKIEGGKVSSYLLNQLKPGDVIKIMGPSGSFTTDFDQGNKRTFILFAGGSGITPLISILKSAIIKEPDSRIVLIYQNRHENSIIFRENIEALKQKFPDRIEVIHVLSQPSNAWTGVKGRLSSDQIMKIFKQLNIQLDHSSFFVCGPKGMMETVDSSLDLLDIDAKKRFKESFFGSDSKKKITNKEQRKKETISESNVKIVLDNEEHDIIVKSDEFILETALDADLNMPFSCQGGICTSCRARLISGNVSMEDPEGLSDEEIEAGYILTCVSHPDSKDIKIEME